MPPPQPPTVSRAHHDRVTTQLYEQLEADNVELDQKDQLISDLTSQIRQHTRTAQEQEQGLRIVRELLATKNEQLKHLQAQSERTKNILEKQVSELKTELEDTKALLKLARLTKRRTIVLEDQELCEPCPGANDGRILPVLKDKEL